MRLTETSLRSFLLLAAFASLAEAQRRVPPTPAAPPAMPAPTAEPPATPVSPRAPAPARAPLSPVMPDGWAFDFEFPSFAHEWTNAFEHEFDLKFEHEFNAKFDFDFDSKFDFNFEPLTMTLGTQPTMLRSGERFPQDPADSAYREARSLLNRGEWRRAAAMFSQVASRTPVSAYAPEALYWQAFSLYRIGGMSELREALTVLDSRKSKFPRARNNEEADALAARVGGALAARGDSEGRSRVREMASTAPESACDAEELSVRSSALSVLMRNDPEAAMPMLTRVLDRKDECSVSLRKSAVMMIGTKGDAAAKTKLGDVAKTDPDAGVRADAIGYLAKVSGDEIVSSLESVIRSDEDEGVQRAAVRALGGHESPRARAAIRALVERTSASEKLRLEALSTFDRSSAVGFGYSYACNQDDCTPLPGQGGRAAPVAMTAPAAPTPSARPAAVALPSSSGRAAPVRATGQYVTSASGEAGLIDAIRWSNSESDRRISPEDAQWLRGVYPRLETTRLKSRAVAVLSRSTDEQTLIWLVDLVQREEEQADVRATVLSRLGRELPIVQLNRLYDGASSRAVRAQIIEVLGDRKEPEATDKLIEVVRTGTDPQLRRSAISALNGKKDPRTTQLLLELIDR